MLAGMFGKKSGDDVFSFGRAPISAQPTFDAEAYSPYAAAWKQFDKLQKEAKGHGSVHWVRLAGEALVFNAGALGYRHGLRKNALSIAGAWAGVALLEAFLWFRRRNQFLHWPCPRCHSEWPGTKTTKDPACKVCGLRLHQLTP